MWSNYKRSTRKIQFVFKKIVRKLQQPFCYFAESKLKDLTIHDAHNGSITVDWFVEEDFEYNQFVDYFEIYWNISNNNSSKENTTLSMITILCRGIRNPETVFLSVVPVSVIGSNIEKGQGITKRKMIKCTDPISSK